ncbi:archaeosortase/exosortase family protein [uncultured Desulfuromonas sp.]|uniref:archaeosortase/exosortase family protein n=1 Tax=uncultured Desulfuromonas sp. TaxID=181013 RepID=UPI00262E7994|nr:archaeosortase/exosortase family protein [uncultured Desulfuromonas sp.]
MAKKRAPAGGQATPEPGGDGNPPPFPMIRVCLLFAALVLGFHMVQWMLVKPWHLEFLQLATARAAAAVIAASGIGVRLEGIDLYMGFAHWKVVLECTAFSAALVYLSFVLAYPASLRSKVLGALAGLPLLFIINVARLFVLAWLVKLWPGIAPFAHDYLWQVLFLFLLVLMWLSWIELVVKRENKAPLRG